MVLSGTSVLELWLIGLCITVYRPVLQDTCSNASMPVGWRFRDEGLGHGIVS